MTETNVDQQPPNMGDRSNFIRVAHWLQRAGKTKNGINMGVQAGCMLEEFVELIEEFTVASASGTAAVLLNEASRLLKEVGNQLKTQEAFLYIYDREAALDAMCDLDVTVNGTAYLAGMNKDRADTLVIDSLFDKFNADGTPVIKPGGKIGKREGWVAPVLAECIGAQDEVSEDEQPFSHCMDARKWVNEFVRKSPGANPEVMLAWFANAIATGYEAGRNGYITPGSLSDDPTMECQEETRL